MRNPKEVQNDEYHEFYKKAFNEFLDPLGYTHFTTEVLSAYIGLNILTIVASGMLYLLLKHIAG